MVRAKEGHKAFLGTLSPPRLDSIKHVEDKRSLFLNQSKHFSQRIDEDGSSSHHLHLFHHREKRDRNTVKILRILDEVRICRGLRWFHPEGETLQRADLPGIKVSVNGLDEECHVLLYGYSGSAE